MSSADSETWTLGSCGEIVAVTVDVAGLVVGVGLVDGMAVEDELFVGQVDAIAGDADGALDEGLADIHGIAEDDDVAAVDVAIGEQEARGGAGRRVGELIDQQVVADEEGVFHGAGGDDESLDQAGGAEQQQDDGDGPFGDEAALLITNARGRRRGLVFGHYGVRLIWIHRTLFYRIRGGGRRRLGGGPA